MTEMSSSEFFESFDTRLDPPTRGPSRGDGGWIRKNFTDWRDWLDYFFKLVKQQQSLVLEIDVKS